MAGGIGAVFSGLSMVVGAIGQSQGQQYEAQKAARAAEIGHIQADQTDAAYREDFNTTLGNIRSIRASTGGDPGSPTSLAYIDAERNASDRVRRIKVGGLNMQATQYENDARYFRSAAKTSLFGGALQAIPAFLGA